MPLYNYQGISAAGKTVKGVKDADSPKVLRQVLKREGIVLTKADESKGGKRQSSGKGLGKEVHLGELLSRVRKAEIAAFTRQASTLLRAGIPLAQTLGALFEQIENVKFKSIIGEVRTAVNEGSSFADALSKHPAVFSELFVSMVRAGEAAGNLDEVLTRLADFLEASQRLKSKVQGAMVYPIIMIVVGTVIMAILMIAVVPKITSLYAQEGKAMAWNTELLIWFSDFVGTWWLVIAIAMVAGFYGFRVWTKTPNGKPIWHKFVLKMPLIGPLVRQVAVSRFTRTLGTMLHAGVPMIRALDISKEVLGNVHMMDAIDTAKAGVTEGESLATMLKKSGYFPAPVIHMVGTGEQAGALEEMLMRVADTYDSEVDMKLDRLTTMLEPLMLVVMGGAVAFVVFSILLPIMDMSKFRAG
jgi:general secretion pathway protein F